MKTLISVLLVGTGGFVGSIARYLASGLVHRVAPGFTFPWGTLAVNVAGCFLIGLVVGLAQTKQLLSSDARLFVMIGLLGGFTTFSTFGFETFALMRDGESIRAAANVVIQVFGGLAAVWLGFVIIK